MKTSNFQKGFTLVEIMIVLSFVSILSTIGIAGFVGYSRTQKLNSATLEVATMLQTAKSRALSQVKSGSGTCVTAQNKPLTGYLVSITPPDTYKLDILCGGSNPLNDADITVTQTKKLPSNISFAASQTFLFNILTGSVTCTPSCIGSSISISLTSTENNVTKTIMVDSRGKIDIN